MSKHKKDKTVFGLVVLLGWLVFILLALIFYFYFLDDLTFVKKEHKEEAGEEETVEKVMLKRDAYPEVNAVINIYFDAVTACDRDVLSSIVTNPDEFLDMTLLEKKADVITDYENITCYTLPGYFEEDKLVYVVSNLVFSETTGVASRPKDITVFYLKAKDGEYVIDNNINDQNIVAYIEKQSGTEDVQGLYREVKNDVEECIQKEQEFADFYNKIYGN